MKLPHVANPLYLNAIQHVYESALMSCGCTLAAVEEVATGKVCFIFVGFFLF